MVMANTERVARALGLLRDGLRPACEAAWRGFYGQDWLRKVNSRLRSPAREPSTEDVSFLLNGVKATWVDLFGHGFGPDVRSLVFEVADVRNRWAHQKRMSSDDTLRALDSMERVLEVFGSSAERIGIRDLRRELMRQMFEEESRSQRRRSAARSTEGTPRAGLAAWRDVITPHEDVAKGRFVQAEYAADLARVVDGDADPEYQDPRAFFSRTYITQGLRELLTGAARRLSGTGGDPVIELQTNFGGGKTHSLIALYHMASGLNPDDLPGLGELLEEEKLTLPPGVNRAVLVGHMISPSSPQRVGGGIRLHTLWGRLAFQLGGRAGYDIVRADDLAGTSPGAALKTLFRRFGPAVVLIDEWVAYARQLNDGSGSETTGAADAGRGAAGAAAARTVGGDFDTQFTFAQALTEAAAAVPDVVVLVSIPASDIEVGGPRGRTALEKLKNVVARKAAQWQPASPDESFEIVRRRLFDPIPSDNYRARDAVIGAFCEMYRNRGGEFPLGVGEGEYRRRMELCYPMHPELFDRLFDDWSALDKFQRTRGVLRLMALVVSQLWQTRRRVAADHAGQPADGFRAAGQRDEEIPRRRLGSRHQIRRGRPQLPAAAPGRRQHPLRETVRSPEGGTHRVHGLRAASRRQTRRGPQNGGAGLRSTRGVSRTVRRRAQTPLRRGHAPLRGRRAVLVFADPERHPHRRRPGRIRLRRPRRRRRDPQPHRKAARQGRLRFRASVRPRPRRCSRQRRRGAPGAAHTRSRCTRTTTPTPLPWNSPAGYSHNATPARD